MAAKKTKREKPNDADVGAAMFAWYAESIREYPDGLVTQAQVSQMLGISRMAVSRLVARGYLRAVYFPKPPDVVGVSIGDDDPTWLKIVGWLGIAMGETETYAWPKACYVSFADVVRLWERGEAKQKCCRDWNEIVAVALDGLKLKPTTKKTREQLERRRKQTRLEGYLLENDENETATN